jgi:hypothetical protein
VRASSDPSFPIAALGAPGAGPPSRGIGGAVLVWQPLQLFDVGAQLSYGIVAAILLYGIPLGEFFKKRFTQEDFLPPDDMNLFRRRQTWIMTRLWESTGISLAAFAASLPLCVAYFGYLAPVSVLLNLAMIPLALVAAVTSVLAIALFLAATLPLLGFLGCAAEFVNHASWLTAWLMERLATAAHAIPLRTFPHPSPHRGRARPSRQRSSPSWRSSAMRDSGSASSGCSRPSGPWERRSEPPPPSSYWRKTRGVNRR